MPKIKCSLLISAENCVPNFPPTAISKKELNKIIDIELINELRKQLKRLNERLEREQSNSD